mgnify:CR=1 FL=1
MKIAVYFPRKKVDLFFEGAMLEHQIVKACKAQDITVTQKVSKDVDIANFINLNAKSTLAIKSAIGLSIPTLMWMFWANNDNQSRIIELTKDGREYIPLSRLDIINMMDGVVVPTNEARIMLRKLGVKIPAFILPGAVGVSRLSEIKSGKVDIFRRYFRIDEEQKYTISVMNVRAKKELEDLNTLASILPDYNFYAFVSAGAKFLDRVRLRAMNKMTAKNLIVSELVPEDVYRSGLAGASYFIALGAEKMNVMTLYEAMYLKIPLIVSKKMVFSEIINDTRAFVVNDYNGAVYVIRNNLASDSLVEKAYQYTQKVTQDSFSESIITLFTNIYSR